MTSGSNGHYIYSPRFPESYGYDHHIEWTETSTSIANNTSSLTFTAYLRSTGASFESADTSSHNNWLSIYWFDDNECSSGYRVNIAEKILSLGINAKYELTGTVTVNHKDDGTLRGYAVSYWTKGDDNSNTPTSGEIATASQALTSLARASIPTASKTSLTLNGTDSVVITTNRASSSFTHTLSFTLGGHTATVKNVGASYTWKPSVANWMPYMTSKEQTVSVSCQTYSGSTKIGSAQSINFKIKVNTDEYKPVIGTITHEDTNDDATTGTTRLETAGTYISGYSNISVSIPVHVNNSNYGSKLKSVVVTYNGVTKTYNTSATSTTITYTASKITATSLKVTVTDSRGVTATKTVTLTLIPYNNPKITAVKVTRLNESSQPSETGTKLRYTINLNYFSGSFGKVNNSLTISRRYKTTSSSSYSSWNTAKTVTTSGTATYKTNQTITGELSDTFATNSQYDLQLRVVDELSNSVIYVKVNEGLPVYAWGADHFDVYGEFHTHDRTNPNQYITYGIDSRDTKSGVNLAAFGFITSSGKNAYIFIPMTKLPVSPNITSLVVAMRIAGGGYLVGADTNLTSEISNVTVFKEQGLLQIVCTRDGGYGVTNNTPMAGKVNLTYGY